LIQPDGSRKTNSKNEHDEKSSDPEDQNDQYRAGDLVAVIEGYEDKTFEVARIIEFVEDYATVRYYGTMAKDIEKAVFKPIWIDRLGRAMFKHETKADQWTGTIAIEDIITKVNLTKNSKLDAESKKSLKNWKMMYLGMA
jgi:hypothetical protein